MRIQEKGICQDQTSGPSFAAPKRNHFYDLRSRGWKEESPIVVTGMLEFFYINVYVLLDPYDTLSFLITLVEKKFDVVPNIFVE